MLEPKQGLAIAVCNYESVAGDNVSLSSDVPYDPRVRTAALFLLIGLDRVDRHVREEERGFQDLMRSEVLEFKFRNIGHMGIRYPNDFERIIEGQRSMAVSRITDKLKERDVYLELSLGDVLTWNDVFGDRLTVYPVEVLDPKRLKKTDGGEGEDQWCIGGGFFLYRVHRSVPPDIRGEILRRIENALTSRFQEVP